MVRYGLDIDFENSWSRTATRRTSAMSSTLQTYAVDPGVQNPAPLGGAAAVVCSRTRAAALPPTDRYAMRACPGQ
jgi:hypothetical protein